MVKDVLLFSQHGGGITLREYQAPVARAIVDSVIKRKGLSFVVMFPRQSGKNELQAQIETYLLTLFSQLNGEIVKVSPTWKPQSLNAMRRLERSLVRNLLTRGRWGKESGYIYKIGSARIFFLSGSPEANIVGATASTLLEVDEAQDVLPNKYDKDIAPMAASTNATRVFWGTAWTSQTLLARELRAARAAELRDGERRAFVLTAEDVGREVAEYKAFVSDQVARMGRNHPMVRTQFFSEEIDAESGMFPASRRALMDGGHTYENYPERGKVYAFLVDVAGGDEAMSGGTEIASSQSLLAMTGGGDGLAMTGGGDGLAMTGGGGGKDGKRDSTSLTIVECDLASVSDELIKAPTYRVVNRQTWTGVNHVSLYGRLKSLAAEWGPRYLVIDVDGRVHDLAGGHVSGCDVAGKLARVGGSLIRPAGAPVVMDEDVFVERAVWEGGIFNF
jgi:hypothetical protein